MVYNALHNDDELSPLPNARSMGSFSPDPGVEMLDMRGGQISSRGGNPKDEIAPGLGIDIDMDIMASPESDLLGQSSWISMYISLTSTILGAGMLGLPYAYAQLGWILGTIMIIACGVAAAFALFFLAKCAKKTTAPSSFYKVASIATPKYAFLIDLIIAVKCFGVATSYLVVVGDLVPLAMAHLFPHATSVHSRTLWVWVGFMVVSPLSSLRSLDALRWTSGLSGVFLAFLVSLVVGYAMPTMSGLDPCQVVIDGVSEAAAAATAIINGGTLSNCHGQRAWALFSPSALHVMPIFVFGYACQQNSFAVVNELRDPSIQRINSVFVASIATAVIVYIIMASAGYMAYGSTVKSNILVSYPNNSITSTARLFVSLVVAFHYPLQAHPARKSLMSLLTHMKGGAEPTECTEYYRRYIAVTSLFLCLSLVVALACTDLGLMLSLVGATGSTSISYILPGIFYYRMHSNSSQTTAAAVAAARGGLGQGLGLEESDEDDGEEEGGGEGPQWLRTLSWYQFVVGLFLVPFSLFAIFYVKGREQSRME